MISVVLLLFLYALCDLARYLLILSSDLFMKILEIIFLITSSRVIGRRFFTGLWVFFSFGSGSNTPVPSFTSALVVSNIPFSILLISWWTSSGAYLISYTLMLSFPGALLLANFCNVFVTSLAVIMLFRILGAVTNFTIGFVLSFLKLFLKCFSIIVWIKIITFFKRRVSIIL